MYGIAGLLIPASLSIVLTISEGGFVEMVDGNPVLDYWVLFTSPLTWAIVVLSIAATLYISAVFLTWYANKARDVEATESTSKIRAHLGIANDHYSRWYYFRIKKSQP